MIGRGFVKKNVELCLDKNSTLCIGIDPVISGMRRTHVIPEKLIDLHGVNQGIKEFCLRIIEAVADYTPLIKPNGQFLLYVLGFEDLKEIVEKIHEYNCQALLDVKLSDVGSTMEAALHWIKKLGFDAVTFSPFPGFVNGVDSVYHWAENESKGIFCLTRMSNPGTHDYQSRMIEGQPLYARIAKDASAHGCNGFVVGCTASKELGVVRGIIGEEPIILSPGLGPQKGDPRMALMLGQNKIGERLLISSSRSINYAYEPLDWDWEKYAFAAEKVAKTKRDELNKIRDRIKKIK
jgi:orotidine-5'-phosphate decarboxylase